VGWLSLLPPILAISLALWKKDVIVALLLAIVAAELILADFQPLTALLHSVDRLSAVFASADNTRILLFSLLVGGLLALIRHSGGVSDFVHSLLRSGLAQGPRSAALLTTLLGVVIFIETYLSVLVCGTFGQTLFDRFGLSRAKLAFIVDTTCSPVSVLILLNGWGAYLLGLLQGYDLANPLGVMLASIPLNFYPLTILSMCFYVAASGRSHAALARHEQQVAVPAPVTTDATSGKGYLFWLPVLVLVSSIIFFMLYTGQGDLRAGDGARSVLYAVLLAMTLIYSLLRLHQVSSHEALIKISFAGMADLLPIVTILLLAFAFGACMKSLAAGEFVATLLAGSVPLWLITPAIFLAGCFVSFTTGTSWGTFAILIPLAIPVALGSGLPVPLLVAAVLSGGIFGDHCSPISDSTILSSLASGCDHMLHVKTQLPYALVAGAASLLLFTVTGLW
jgi:tetracycline resistance efflux pump